MVSFCRTFKRTNKLHEQTFIIDKHLSNVCLIGVGHGSTIYTMQKNGSTRYQLVGNFIEFQYGVHNMQYVHIIPIVIINIKWADHSIQCKKTSEKHT